MSYHSTVGYKLGVIQCTYMAHKLFLYSRPHQYSTAIRKPMPTSWTHFSMCLIKEWLIGIRRCLNGISMSSVVSSSLLVIDSHIFKQHALIYRKPCEIYTEAGADAADASSTKSSESSGRRSGNNSNSSAHEQHSSVVVASCSNECIIA